MGRTKEGGANGKESGEGEEGDREEEEEENRKEREDEGGLSGREKGGIAAGRQASKHGGHGADEGGGRRHGRPRPAEGRLPRGGRARPIAPWGSALALFARWRGTGLPPARPPSAAWMLLECTPEYDLPLSAYARSPNDVLWAMVALCHML